MNNFYYLLKGAFFILLNVLISAGFAQDTWVKAGAGSEFSAALKSDGTLWTWGVNLNGQLGIGSTAQQNLPIEVNSESTWIDFACGGFHMVAIKDDGTLWGWGLNGSGQLGLGSTSNMVNSPLQIGTDSDWMKVYASQAHTVALKQDGSLWGWGWNFYGQIGVGNTNDQLLPAPIESTSQWLQAICGGAHTLAIRADSTLWAFGANLTGQLGEGMASQSILPIQVGLETDWVEISAGFEFSAGLKSNGTLWTWGFNGNGQLGQGDINNRSIPTQVGSNTNWTSIGAGSSYMFAINSDNALFGSGFNGNGQLGIGNTQQQTSLIQVGEDEDWAEIWGASGAFVAGVLGMHSLGLKHPRTSICTAGANNGGQLGDGTIAPIWEITCQTGVLSVNITESESPIITIALYPNPAQDIINLQIDRNFSEKLICKIYSITGSLVLEKAIQNNSLSLNLHHLEKGVYMIAIESESTTNTQRLILN